MDEERLRSNSDQIVEIRQKYLAEARQAFSRQKEGEREKALHSTDHRLFRSRMP